MSFSDCVNDFCVKELLLRFKCADPIALRRSRSDSLCQHFMALGEACLQSSTKPF